MTGVRVQLQRDSGGPETISADLVVDASGRGSHSPAWRYAKPREEAVQVHIGYMTRLYRRRPEHLRGKQAIVMAACRPGWRFGVILAQEDERWIVTLGGYLGDHPPIDDAGYIEFARSLPKPEIFELSTSFREESKSTPRVTSRARIPGIVLPIRMAVMALS